MADTAYIQIRFEGSKEPFSFEEALVILLHLICGQFFCPEIRLQQVIVAYDVLGLELLSVQPESQAVTVIAPFVVKDLVGQLPPFCFVCVFQVPS